MIAYRKEVDGLRALAVLPVIFFHAGFATFDGGYVGVDVFFVISGYLITSIILAEKTAGTFTLAGFYERRARRILPALIVVVVLCFPFAWLWMTPEQLQRFSEGVVAVAVFASNFFFEHEADYFTKASDLEPLIHTWSLAIEEQFYLLFPLFVLLFWGLGRRWMAAIMLVTALAGVALTQLGGNLRFSPPFVEEQFAWFDQPTWMTFFLTPARAWELQVGVLVAFFLEGRRRAPDGGSLPQQAGAALGLLAILAAIFLFDRHTPFPGFFSLLPTLGAALVIVCAHPDNLVGRLLSLRPMVWIGLISYSAYLWHQPLFAFARIRHPNTPSPALFLVLVLVTLVLAYLSWRWVERPFRNRALVSRPLVVRSAVLCCAVLIAAGALGHWNEGFVTRFPPEALQALEAGRNHVRDKVGCRDVVVDGSPACEFGAEGSQGLVLLIGNSHAGMLVAGLDEALRPLGLRGLHFPAPDKCASLPFRESHTTDPRCTAHAAFVLRFAEQAEGVRRVVVAHRWTTALLGTDLEHEIDPLRRGLQTGRSEAEIARITDRMKQSLARILEARGGAVVVYPVPETGFQVPKRTFWAFVERDAPDFAALATDQGTFIRRNRVAYDMLDEVARGHAMAAVYPERIFCSVTREDRCDTVAADGSPLYFDNNHLSLAGSRRVADEVVKHLR